MIDTAAPEEPGRASRLDRSRVVRGGRAAVYRWRSSLQLRVVTSTLVLGTVALFVLGGYLSGWIRDGLFSERVGQLLEESARAAQRAQSSFNDASAATPAEVQQLMRDLLHSLQASGSGQPDVFLRPLAR